MPNLSKLTPEIIKNYQDEISKNSSVSTVKRKAVSLNKFFDWAQEKGHIDANPLKPAVTVAPVNSNPYIITHPTNYRKIGMRSFAILGVTTGLVILIFLLMKNVKNVINFVKTPAQELTTVNTPVIVKTPQKTTSPLASSQPTLTANSAVNGSWNLYASLKLSDSDGVPMVGNQSISFKVYNSPDAVTPLFQSPVKSVTTDTNGTALISLDSVPTNLFFENNKLYLEPSVGSVSASLRIPISTANTAANLNGYFPSELGLEQTIPVIDENGSLVLASESPALKALNGNLLVEGQALTIKTADGTDGNIEINPDGKGITHFLFEGTGKNFLNAQAPNLTSGSLYYGIVANNATGYDLVRLQNGGGKPVTRFSVDALGNTYMTGNEIVKGNLSVNGIANSSGYTQSAGNFVVNQNVGDFASITKTGSALSDVMTLTLDERNKPTNPNSNYSTLVLNRFDGSNEGAALKVANGNAIFNGQLQLGRYASTPSGIGQGSLVYNTSDNQVYVYNGSTWSIVGAGSSVAFNNILSGTNTSAVMILGSGSEIDINGGNFKLGGSSGLISQALTSQGSGSPTWTNIVNNISGTANQITTSSTTGNVTLSIPSDFRVPGTIQLNGITYTFPASQSTNYVLQTDGAGALSWVDPSIVAGASNYWNLANGVLNPKNSSADVLFGGDSTTSAKFAFINTLTGTPTASISGTYITADGNIANTNMEHLTLGGSTTGQVDVNNNLDVNGTTEFNNLVYTWPSSQNSNYVLQTDGSGVLSWVDPSIVAGASNYWDQASGALFNKNNTVDVLFGASSTSAAKFAFTGVNSGTPTASISGTYLTSTGNLANTSMRNLTLGGSTTGNVIINSRGTNTITANATTTTFAGDLVIPNANSIAGVPNYAQFNNGVSVGGGTTYYLSSGGNLSSSSITNTGTTTFNGLAYTWPVSQSSNYVLQTNGAGTLSWVDPAQAVASTIYWTQSNGVLNPKNNTVDVLIGSNTTESAKFAFTGVNSGTPTASISGTYLTSDGNLANTSMENITLGGATTGNIIANSPVQVNNLTPLTAVFTDANNKLTSTGNYVKTITGTANQITASASTWDITLSIPSDFRAPGTLNAVNGLYTGATAGTQRIDSSGNLVNIGTTQFNNLTYTWPSAQSNNYVLQTNGTGTLSWVDPATAVASSIYWTQANGVLNPKNNTVDVLIGSDTTSSAKFAFTGVNSGTPTASISGTYLTSDGNLANTNMEHLTLGGSTTGGVDFNSPITSGTWNGSAIGATYGGTGQTSYTVGDILYSDTTTSLAKLSDVAVGNVLISGGVGVAPSWNKVVLGTHTSGNYVSSLAGTANQITASSSTGDITLSIPSDFRAPGTINAVNGLYTGATAGTQRIDSSGNLVNIGTTQFNNLTYTWPSAQSNNYVLQTNGAGTLSWVDPAIVAGASNYWNQINGSIFPKNNSIDFLIGSDATSSSKFAITGVNSNSPTATLSGTYLTSTGNLATTQMQHLTLGGSTTGQVDVNNNLNLTAGNAYLINDVSVLNNNTLGSGIVNSSLTSVGTLGSLTVSGTTTFGGLTYTWPGSQSTNAVLQTNGAGVLSWVDPNSSNLWDQSLGALYPKNNSVDFLVGADATASSKFAITGVNSNSPTATLSGTYLTSAGNLANTSMRNLTLGGSTTGNVIINSRGQNTITANGVNTTLAGDLTIPNANTIAGVPNFAQFNNGISVGGSTTYYLSSLGDANINGLTVNGTTNFVGKIGSNILPSTNNIYDLGSSSFKWANIYATAFTQNGNTVCDSSDNCLVNGPWVQNAGVLNPKNNTVDVLIGANTTASAKFAFTGVNSGTPTASISGTYLTSDGNLANTNMEHLTLGGSTTGQVDVNNNLNVSTGNGYLINNTSVLTNNTLGSGVINSSLTQVGALTSGSIASGFGSILTTNGITGGTLTSTGTTTFGGLTYTWPGAQSANAVLSTNGSGTLSWIDPAQAVSSTIYWTQNNGVLNPKNNTVDVLIGANTTESAKFAFTGVNSGTPTASISGTYLTSDGNLANTSMKHLTLGGSTTGQIDSANDLNLVTGKSYLINNTSVLNNNTLGSGVINSSLTQVGALTSGSIASGFGSILTTNGITGGTLTSTGTTTFGGLTYTWPGAQSANAVLQTNGAGTLSWVDANTFNYWNQASGALFTKNNTVDFLVGSNATETAKFAITNVLAGNPTATLSGTYLTADGNLANTNMEHLTLGGSTTGQVDVSNDLNLANTKSLLINNVSTLNATTLGSAVINSSLTGVGALTSGSIASGFGSILTTNGITGGTLTSTGTTTFGGLTYTWPGSQSSSYVLSTNGAGTLSWVDPASAVASTIYWTQGLGVLNPKNNTVDVLIGSNATSTAKFAFTGVNSGTPTASISGTYLTADGNLANTSMKDITLGGTGTGNIIANSPVQINNLTPLTAVFTDANNKLTSTGNYVSTLTGTANQITASSSTGDITLSIPSDFRAPGTLNAVNGIYTGATAGTQRIDSSGNLVNIGTTQFNNLTYTWPASQSTGAILSTNGAGTLSWVDPNTVAASTIYWTQNNGVLNPKNNTVDVLIGSNATSTAKFAFTGVNSGTPTASISGTYLTSTGNLANTEMKHLTLGGSTTGGVDFNSPITSGTWNGSAIGATYGGTGITSYAVGDLLTADTTTTLSRVADVATGKVLRSGGVGVIPAWGDAVLSLAGTANQITASAGTGDITLSIPSDFRAPGTVNAVTGLYTGATAGTQRIDSSGNLTNIGTTQLNNLTYTWPSSQSTNYLLQTNGTGTLSWVDPNTVASSTIYWTQNNGVLNPKNNTVDVLIGANTTASAKFAFTGVTSGTPTASISGTYLTSTGILSNTSMKDLTIGSATTGNVTLNSRGNNTLIANGANLTAAGTITLPSSNTITGLPNFMQFSNGVSVGGATTYYFDSTGNINALAGTFGGNVAVNGGSLTTTQSTANIFTSNATAINLGAANTALTLGGNSTINGGSNSNGTLTLSSTSNGTKGNIQFFTSSNTIDSSGNLTLAGTATVNGNTVLGNATSDTIDFQARVLEDSDLIPVTATGTNDLGTALLPWDNVYAGNVYQGGNLVCDSAGTNCPVQFNLWNQANGALYDNNNTVDFLIGASSTASAKFAITGVNSASPIATLSGTYLTSAGNLANTNMEHLTLGGSTTGQVDVNNNLNVSTGNGILINNASVLNSTTLGSSVINSSLTQVGALASGSIANGFGTISTANNINGSSLSTNTTQRIDNSGNLTNIGTTQFNNLTYTWPASQTNTYVLQTNGSGTLSWVDPTATNYWDQALGAIFTKNNTEDLLIGSNATSSAKFAITGVNSASPIATLSGTYFTNAGNLATTKMQHLTLGGSTTGQVDVSNDLNLASTKALLINGANTLNATTLGSAVVSSSLTSLGNLTGLTNNGNTTLGDNTSDTITVTGRINSTVNPSANNTYDFGSSGLKWATVYATSFNQNGNAVCDSSNNCAGSVNYWGQALGSTYALNNSADLLIGSNATSSAKFAITGVNGASPVATLSGTYLTSAGNLANTEMKHLTLGGSTTGQVDVSNDLNLATGKALLINGVNTLNATTLGSAVVNSSLTSLGNLTGLTNNGNTTLGDNTSDTITITGRINSTVNPSANNTYDLGSSGLKWANIYATAFTQNGNTVCDSSNNCAGSVNFWNQADGALYDNNNTVDFLIGSSATSSAKFAITNVNSASPIATLSGTYLTSAGNLANTEMKHLTLGGSTTGQVDVSNDLNLASTKALLINGANTLNATTLGSAVVNSSLTQVGALASGSIASGFGSILTTNGITGGTLTSTGTIALPNSNTLTGVSNYVQFNNGVSVGAGTTNHFDSSGNIVANDLNTTGNTTLGNATGDTITVTGRINSTVNPSANNTYDLGSSGLKWANVYATAFTQNGNTVCDSSNNCGASASYWDQSSGALYNLNNTVDVLIGASSTASAKFAFKNVLTGVPTASISGNVANVATYLDGNGNLSTTNMAHLTIGSTTTGQVDVSNDLNLATGKALLINGVNTLNATTLGSAVINSSLTSLGNLTSLTNNGNTTLGDAITDNITFTGRANSSLLPIANNTYDLGSLALKWANVYATTFNQNGNTVCDSSLNCQDKYWQLNNKVISPANSTYDLTVGGTATGSAFQVFGIENATGDIAKINSTVITSGNLIEATASAITSGNIIKLGNGGNNGNFTGNGIFMDFDNTGGNSFTGDFLHLNKANSQVLTINANGDITTIGDLAVNGDDITSDGTLGILGATGLTLQATTGTVTLDSIAASQTINVGASNVARTLNLGTGTGIDTINLGTGATGVDVIRIGSATADLALTDANWSITTAGLITTADDLAVNGDDITSDGDLTIDPAGGQLILADTHTLNVGGATNVGYNAFANAADTPASTSVTADNDLFVGGDFEVKGGLYLTGRNIYNVVGGVSTGAIAFAADPVLVNSYNVLGYGSWLVQNSTNPGIAALMVDQTKAGDIFVASASGVNKFRVDTSGNVTMAGDLAITGGNITTAVTADSSLTVTGTLTTNGILDVNGQFVLGDNGDTGAIDTSDWDISATGDMTGIGAITADGTISFTGTTIGLGTSNSVTTFNIGTGTAGNTFNIATNNTTLDTLNVGSALDNVIINGAGAGSLINFANFDVATTGNITVAAGVGLDTNASGILNIGNTTATTISIGDTAATTLEFGAGGALARAINVGTGTGIDTINVGTGATGVDVIRIGSATADLALTDAQWSITTAGLITTAGDIAVNGDDITSDGTLGILGATGLTLQATTGTVTLDSIAASQIINVGASNVARTLNLGTGTGIDTINLGTGATGVDVIRIGSATADLALTDAQWSITTAGLITTAGDIAVNGDDITSDGTLGILGATGLTLQATTGTVTLDSIAASQIINVGASNVARTLNLGTGTGVDTIHIGDGATGSDVITIGGGVGTLAINTGDWDIGTTGAMTGIGAITADGIFTLSNNATMSGTLTVGNGTTNTIQSPYGPLSFNAKTGANTWATALTIDDISANVGVGTTTPASLLHIAQASSTLSGSSIVGLAINTDILSTGQAISSWSTDDASAADEYFLTLRTEQDSTPDNEFIFTTNGSFALDNATITSPADYAEYFHSAMTDLPKGTLISLDENGSSEITKATKAGKSRIIGVISTQPGFVGNASSNGNDASFAERASSPNWHIVGLIGQIPVLVSTENGSIKAGDPLTIGSIPGVAVKALEEGLIVGRAQESYTNSDPSNVGKIMGFITPIWNNPDVYLTSTGNLNIDSNYQVTNTADNSIITKISTLASLVAGNIKSGYVESQDFVTNNLVAKVIKTEMISPMDGSTNVAIKIGSEATPSGKLIIENSLNEEVASIDNLGNASFAGIVRSQNIDEIQNLLTQIQFDQNLMSQYQDVATSSAVQNLYVLNQATINSLSVSENLTTNKIDSLTEPLRIQSLASFPIELMAGLVKIDTNGNVDIAGNLNVAGKITTPNAEIKDIKVDNFTIAKSIEATDSGVVTSGVITTNATAGKAIIPAGTTEITVKNNKVTDYSLVYTTPTSDTQNNVLYVKSKIAGEFVVGFTNPITTDANFNWWIVQVSQ